MVVAAHAIGGASHDSVYGPALWRLVWCGRLGVEERETSTPNTVRGAPVQLMLTV
jgi:hypothetical protein